MSDINSAAAHWKANDSISIGNAAEAEAASGIQCATKDIFSELSNTTDALVHLSFHEVGSLFGWALGAFFLLGLFWNLIKLQLQQISGGDLTYTMVWELGLYLLLGTLLLGGSFANQSMISIINFITELGPFLAVKIIGLNTKLLSCKVAG